MKTLKFKILIIIFLFPQLHTIVCQITNENLIELDNLYQETIDSWNAPSIAVGIVKEGQIIFNKGYGMLDESKNIKADANSLYGIASNSKTFISTIVAMLVDEGKLNWEDKVKTYLPYFELSNQYVSNEVSIRDLLCHRVGHASAYGDIMLYKSNLTAEEQIRRLKYFPLTNEFRTEYGYSNYMYVVAGEIIKQVTQKSWHENVKEKILTPLGMNRTVTSTKLLDSMSNVAQPHSFIGEKNIRIEYLDLNGAEAAGGIVSTVNDMCKWMMFNLNKGVWNGDTLLSNESFSTLRKPHVGLNIDHSTNYKLEDNLFAYGLGWYLSDYKGKYIVRHRGGNDGMHSAITLVPDENLGVVVLSNCNYTAYRVASYTTIDMLLNLAKTDWFTHYFNLDKEWKRSKGNYRSDRLEKRVRNTHPTHTIDKYIGVFRSNIHGDIIITLEGDELILKFDRARELNATLQHWHYDTWEIKWAKHFSWFEFGTIRFIMDNNLEITGLDFDIPSDDLNFEDLEPIIKVRHGESL